MKYHYIYQTTNLIDVKIYIGKHSNVSLQNTYFGSGTHLKRAIQHHGKCNFKKDILLILHTEACAYEWERIFVDNAFVQRTDTYNLKCGGRGGMCGYTTSSATRLKQSVSHKNPPEEVRLKQRIGRLGKHHTNYSKQLMSDKKKGVVFSTEHKQKLLETHSSDEFKSKVQEIKRNNSTQFKLISISSISFSSDL